MTVLSVANGREQFVRRVTESAADIGLDIDKILWSEPLDERLNRYDIDDYLLKLADEAKHTKEVRYGTFHIWETEE